MKNKIIETILDLYIGFGQADYIGEPISQIEHMSQACELAIAEGYDDEVVLAAFFHDIGHLCTAKMPDNDMNGLGIKNHEKVGGAYLRGIGFSEKIAALVEGHVEAKRYLCYRMPEYHNNLSTASKETLVLQGGIMTPEEAIAFEKNPLSSLMIKMRGWDEAAKIENVPIIDLNIIKEKMFSVLPSRKMSVLFF